jgi:hypothetical protein
MACGLCCDGTLFHQVRLEPDGEADKLSACGLEIVSDQKNAPAIRQPCSAHKNCACSIYAERPSSCRSFQCKLLKRFKRNEIPQAEALAIIREAVAYRDHVKRTMRPVFGENFCTFNEFTLRLRAGCKNAASAKEKEQISELFRNFAVLWRYIDRHFQDRWLR